ncbi:toll/interleukin-1 receptor domain-containing protein [Bacillus marinisedimentorum]|uniref:toll/interleukin-1 receptor domain-containing protein n=1 Tax=Bacillus marinisedimentorum TaxID=1821260 RepID=UPI0007E02D95|nr:toll/interleukin-1 receptor domain-containing protein [Bacillus marinisedimentorum]
MKGKNMAAPTLFEAIQKMLLSPVRRPCIFLSHINIDKEAAIAIGDFITDRGIDIYLDVYDECLWEAAGEGDAGRITECIEQGLSRCTHMMCIVSEDTKNSWWVPYEVGYGKKSSQEISTLYLKDVSGIPAYLRVTRQIKSLSDLAGYLEEIKKDYYATKKLAEFSSEVSGSVSPIDKYLKL